MKDLIRIIFISAVSIMQLLSLAYGQVRLNAYPSQTHYQVTSYLGLEGMDRANNFQLDLEGTSFSLPNWSLSVRLAAPVRITEGGPSKSGAVFPMNKISFRWTQDNTLPNMNLQSFGVNRNEIILQEGNELMLIDRAKAPLVGQASKPIQLMLHGTFKVAQGKYLEQYQSNVSKWKYITYVIPLVYTVYDEYKKVLTSGQVEYQVQIKPDLTDGHLVDVEPEYSMIIATEAVNAKLQFRSTRDYLEGVSVNIDNAVKVNAKTNFEIRVKSLDAELTRNGGGSLPLSVLSTKLTLGNNAKPVLSNPELTMLTSEQVLLSGTSKNQKDAQYFNLNYKAKLTSAQLGLVKPGDYSLSLLYLLLPK